MVTHRYQDGSKTVYSGSERTKYDKDGKVTEHFVARTPSERENLAHEQGYMEARALAEYEARKDSVDLKTREELAWNADVWDRETMGPPGF